MKFSEFDRRQLRLTLLQSLNEQSQLRTNDVVLQYEARQFGFERARDVIRQELRFLEQIGAVKLEQAGYVVVATLKLRGQEHVKGLTELEGVDRPSAEG